MKATRIFTFVLLCFSVQAASPTYQQFDTNNFASDALAGYIRANTNWDNPKALATKGDLSLAVTNNFQPIFVNGGWFITNATGWTFQGSNGVYVSSNAVNATCFVTDSNRNTIWLSNNVVVASNNATSGDFTTSGQITVKSNLTSSASGAIWSAPLVFTAGLNSAGTLLVQNSRVAIGLLTSTADLAVLDGSNQNVREHAYLMSGPNWGGTFSSKGNLAVGTNNVASHGALEVWGNGWFTGGITASGFTGDGSALTGLNASALASGTVPLAQLPASVVTNNLQPIFTNGGWYITNATGWTFQGSNGLYISSNAVTKTCEIIDTNRNFILLSNNIVMVSNNAATGNVFNRFTTSGQTGQFNQITNNGLNPGVMQGNWNIDGALEVSGSATFDSGVTADTFNGDGSGLTDLDASQLGGTIPVSVLPAPLIVGANLIEQKNGTTAQRLNLYGSFTDSSNYKRLSMYFSSGDYMIDADAAGTGLSVGDLRIRTIGNHSVRFATSGTPRWRIENSGGFSAETDNSFDIGANGANRPRTGYFGTSVVTPAIQVGVGGASISGDGALLTLDGNPTLSDGPFVFDATTEDVLVIRSPTSGDAITIDDQSGRVSIGGGFNLGGNGQDLVELNASQLTDGMVPMAVLSDKVTTNNGTLSGMMKGDGASGVTNATAGIDYIAPAAILTNSIYDTNVVVSTNNWSWPGPTNNLDYARGTLQRYRPASTTGINITNVLHFPAGQVGSVVLWIENTNTSAISVKLPATCEATNSLGGLTVSVNASNRLQVLMSVAPSMAGASGSTNVLFSDQQLIK